MVDIFDLYRTLRDEGVIFCFCGPTSQTVIEGIGETLRQRMELEGIGTTLVNRIFSVFIEQVHNILLYSTERIATGEMVDEELGYGIVLVGSRQGRYYVRCGNLVRNDLIDPMRVLLEQIRGMGKEELKTLYKERRRSTEPVAGSRGAGLGIIEMARKASEPLEFHILPVDAEMSFFTIIAII